MINLKSLADIWRLQRLVNEVRYSIKNDQWRIFFVCSDVYFAIYLVYWIRYLHNITMSIFPHTAHIFSQIQPVESWSFEATVSQTLTLLLLSYYFQDAPIFIAKIHTSEIVYQNFIDSQIFWIKQKWFRRCHILQRNIQMFRHIFIKLVAQYC